MSSFERLKHGCCQHPKRRMFSDRDVWWDREVDAHPTTGHAEGVTCGIAQAGKSSVGVESS